LAHVISDDRRGVTDVTSIHSRLFVLRQQQIQVYDTKTFKQQPPLRVKNLSDETLYGGLTSCVTNYCVYVSDSHKGTVYKVELSGINKVSSWHVGSDPRGLSVNTACNLLVACYWANKIQEYTTNGSLVREILLGSNDVDLRPRHAIQLTNDQFVVSCVNMSDVSDVVEVDEEGRVVVSYRKQLQSTTQHEFAFPRHLSVGKNNESILVADTYNNRIVILNRSLNYCDARELNAMSVDGRLKWPSCLYFDVSKNRLFVGEWRGQRRVLVFNIAHSFL
jgi:hypothetical protein